MRRGVGFVVLMVMCAALLAGCARAPKAFIGDVLDHPDRYQNTPVVLFGVVSNSEALQPQLGQRYKFRGQYTLTEDGRPITVKTVKNPPANNTEVYVRGIVTLSDAGPGAVPILQQRTRGPFEPGTTPWPLVAALVVLVVLAAVLVYMLVHPKPVREAEEVPGPTPPTAPGEQCPSCQFANVPGAEFCQQCGYALGEGPTDLGDDRPRADLTVIDGAGMGGPPFSLYDEFRGRPATHRVGRAPGMDIRLAGDDRVSREHAAIWWEDGQFHIQDLKSTHGTYVNGQRVFKQALADRDIIQVGRTRLSFRMIPQQEPVAP